MAPEPFEPVVAPHRVDILAVFLDERGHHCLALGGAPVGVLQVENLDAGIGIEDLVSGLDPVFGGAGPGDAGDHDDVALALEGFGDPLGHSAAERPVVGIDQRQVVVRSDAAIREDHRCAGLHRAGHDRIERLFRRRPDDQDIGLALKQILDVGDLLVRIVIGVGDDQLLDDVLVLRRHILKRVQPADRPDIRDRGIRYGDGPGGAFLNFEVSVNWMGRAPQKCTRGALPAFLFLVRPHSSKQRARRATAMLIAAVPITFLIFPSRSCFPQTNARPLLPVSRAGVGTRAHQPANSGRLCAFRTTPREER